MNTQSFLEKLNRLIDGSQNILITSHKDPDDDSISSVLSLYQILKEKNPSKNLQVIYTTPFDNRYAILEDFSVIQFDRDLTQRMNSFDLAIFLDLSRLSQFTDDSTWTGGFSGKKVAIDHHATSPDSFDLEFIDPTAVSTSQLIYQIFCQSDLSPQVAKSLFLGIYGDSGSFEFVKPTQVEVFNIAAKLIQKGQIDVQEFLSHIECYSYNIFKIISEFVKNSQIIYFKNSPGFFYSYIDDNTIKNNRYSYSEVADASHIFRQTFLTSLNEASWGATFYPGETGEIHAGFRSRPGSVNVRKIVEDLKIGGGHDRAAGGTFQLKSVSEALESLKNWIETHKSEIS